MQTVGSIACPGCGYENPGTTRFCHECGRSVARRCVQCEAELTATMKFCGVLGPLLLEAQGATSCFPGRSSVFTSSTGSYSLRYEKPREDPDEKDLHHVFLKAPGEPEREFWQFARQLCAYWSPSDTFLAISTYPGSDSAEVWICDATRGFDLRPSPAR